MIHRVFKVNQTLGRNTVLHVLRPQRNLSSEYSHRGVCNGLSTKASGQTQFRESNFKGGERVAGVEQRKAVQPRYFALPWAGSIQHSLGQALGCILSPLPTGLHHARSHWQAQQLPGRPLWCCQQGLLTGVVTSPPSKISITHLFGLQINWQHS